MYPIVKKEKLADKIYLMDVKAPRVAQYCEPGQFVIVKMDEKGERIPLTICDYDREAGTITIVFQPVGASTTKMKELKAGDYFRDFTGPLGNASELVEEDIEELKKKKILFVGGGVGAAPVYPQVKWLHEHGVDADVIIGSKTKDMLILEKEMEAVSGNYYPCTDDGSYGHAGMVTTMVEELVEKGNKYDVCIAIGPMIMMKFVCLLTKKLEIPTVVSMNPIMVDGTGMCGACRLHVGDEIKFACVDGPEFDGHLVNFDEAMKRQQMYKSCRPAARKHDSVHGCSRVLYCEINMTARVILAVAHLALYAHLSEHKILSEHIFNIAIYLRYRIYISICHVQCSISLFLLSYANFASTPFTNAPDSSAPYFFASSTASFIETFVGISSSNFIS